MYSFGRAVLLLLVEVYNHTVPVRERRRIRVNILRIINEPLLKPFFFFVTTHFREKLMQLYIERTGRYHKQIFIDVADFGNYLTTRQVDFVKCTVILLPIGDTEN